MFADGLFCLFEDKFKAQLVAGKVSLDKTRVWLAGVKRSLLVEALSSNDAAGAFLRGVSTLVLSPTPLTQATLPEVLALDEEILESSRLELRRLILVATLMTLSRNLVPDMRSAAFGAAEMQERLVLLLKDPGTQAENVSIFLISEFAKRLTSLGKPTLSPQHQSLFKGLVARVFEENDTILK